MLYLNGVRVADSGGIVGNPPAFNASGGQAAEPPTATVDLTSHKNLLVTGENVLAIQVHNATLSGSSDCFGAPCCGESSSSPRPATTRAHASSSTSCWPTAMRPPAPTGSSFTIPAPPPISLSNVYLSDDPQNLLQYKIPNGTMLQPGQFWAVREGTSSDSFPFALDFSGETVYVTLATADAKPQPIRVLDAVRYGNMEPDVTFGRYPDGSDSLDCLASGTFGKANARRMVRDIVINEIMYHHAARDERYEYVELYNRGTSSYLAGRLGLHRRNRLHVPQGHGHGPRLLSRRGPGPQFPRGRSTRT